MNEKILKQVIQDQKKEITQKIEGKLVERENKEHILPFLKYPNIVVILGVRRSGKSVFSIQLAQQLGPKTAYINFDDERLLGIKTEDLNKILQCFYELYGEVETIILDEIQNAPGWELFANRLRRTKKVIITGSNSKLLSGELATRLTGRYIDFTLYPFSFKESIETKPDMISTEGIARTCSELNKYIQGSSFPEYKKFGSSIVVRIYEDIINKDCIRRYKIRQEQTFRELAKYMVSNFANEFTYSKLSKIFGIKDVHTAKNYVTYLKEAFLIAVIERFSPKLKQQAIAPKKAYITDHGLGNFIGFRLTDNIGAFFENIVCIELLRKKAVSSKIEIYYWKSLHEEVDFVIKEGTKIEQLLQVCYNITNYDTKKRETKALLKASKELKCSNLLIITEDTEAEEKIEGKTIKYIPLWKWLLTPQA